MNGRVLVMCASRERPDSLVRMVSSVKSTSDNADVVVYLDDDDRYNYPKTIPGATVVVGPRHGQCTSLNSIAHHNPGYSAYGAATDDCIFETPGWDEWVLGRASGFPAGIGAISPYCELYGRMDFPWVTGEWLKVAGRFVPMNVRHFYWDVALELVGEDIGISYATQQEFHVSHEGIIPPKDEGPITGDSMYNHRVLDSHRDSREVCRWLALDRKGFIKKMLDAQSLKESA